MHVRLLAPIAVLLTAAPAVAQDDSAKTPTRIVNGSAAIATDYRLRGVSQSEAASLAPSFSKRQDSVGSIADRAILASLTAVF